MSVLNVWKLKREQKAWDAGYKDGFGKEVKDIFVPKEFFVTGLSKKYRDGFRVGQFDYKVERI